jgi:hypothetical protein
MEDVDTTHANSTKIEKEVQNVIEKDLALWDQVANAKRATNVIIVLTKHVFAKELIATKNVAIGTTLAII